MKTGNVKIIMQYYQRRNVGVEGEFLKLNILFNYLFQKVRVSERKRENFLPAGSVPRWRQENPSQEPGATSGYRCPSTWAIPECFPGPSTGSCVKGEQLGLSGAHRDPVLQTVHSNDGCSLNTFLKGNF